MKTELNGKFSLFVTLWSTEINLWVSCCFTKWILFSLAFPLHFSTLILEYICTHSTTLKQTNTQSFTHASEMMAENSQCMELSDWTNSDRLMHVIVSRDGTDSDWGVSHARLHVCVIVCWRLEREREKREGKVETRVIKWVKPLNYVPFSHTETLTSLGFIESQFRLVSN